MTRAEEWLSVPMALAVVLVSVNFAAWVLVAGSGSAPESAPALASVSAPAAIGTPLARNPRTLMLAERSRDVLIGLAAPPGGPVDLLAIPSDGRPLPPDAFRVAVAARPVTPSSCGAGCFRLRIRALSGARLPLAITIVRPGRKVVRVRFLLPARLPPSGQALFRSVERVMGGLRTLRIREVVASGVGVPLRSRYEIRAPDRLRLRNSIGQAIVLIGGRRWQLDGRRWTSSRDVSQLQPSYPWRGATHARLLGKARVGGVPVRVLALYKAPLPFGPVQVPVWFRLLVAADGRVLEMEMLSRAHFMEERFGAFNAPLEIEPPS